MGGLVAGGPLYSLIIQAIGTYWSINIYYGDYLENAREHLIKLLNERNIKYRVIERSAIEILYLFFIPKRYKVIIERPFKAEISFKEMGSHSWTLYA